MRPTIIYLPNPFDSSTKKVYRAEEKLNFLKWLHQTGYINKIYEQPIVIMLNGKELTEDQYDFELAHEDIVTMTAMVQDFITPTVILVIAAVSVAAVGLTLYFMPEPDMPSGSDAEEGSPTYSANSKNNRARLGQPKPVIYGKLRTYPDLSAQPFNEFNANDDQILYQLFEITQGECDIDLSTARFEDTLLSNFADVETEVIQPGENSALFPSIVIVSTEVQNLPIEGTVGPYSANEPATLATQLAFDIVASGGIYYTNDDGDFRAYEVELRLEAQPIDDAGATIGPVQVLGNEIIGGSSREPIRRTFSYPVSAGRYQCQIVRVTIKNDDIKISDTLQWTQLKGYLKDDLPVTTTTRLAIRLRSSEQIGNRALSRFNVVSQRKIPYWTSDFGWNQNVASSSVVWAFADAIRNFYGGNLGDSYIDLPTLETLDTLFTDEGHECNLVFDTHGTLWDALIKICQCAQSMPVNHAGVFTIVADRLNPVSTQLFTMRNIVRDSFAIDFSGVLEETNDSVKVKFLDKEQDYRESSLIATLTGGTTDKPREVRLFGVTNKEQAFNNAMYLAASNFYRRQTVTFVTGIEGRIPFYGDKITVSHMLIVAIGAIDVISGDIISFNGTDTIEVSENLNSVRPPPPPFLVIRMLDGSPTIPLMCVVEDDYHIRITDGAFSPSWLNFESNYERQQFTIGEGTEFFEEIKVTSIEPQGNNQVKISGFVDRTEVYDAAEGLPVPPITTLPDSPDIIPVVTELQYSITGTASDPIVTLSWNGANADAYLVEKSLDGGSTWLPVGVGSTTETRFTDSPDPGVINYRVAPVSIYRGEWVSVIVDTSQINSVTPLAPFNLQVSEPFVGPTLKIDWEGETSNFVVEFWYGGTKRISEILVGAKNYELAGTVAREAGIQRSFEVRVYSLSFSNILSTTAATLSVSNPRCAQINNVSVAGLVSTINILFDPPPETDFNGINVWASYSTGFAPTDENKVVDRTTDPLISLGLSQSDRVYVRLAAMDVWGDDANVSGEYSVIFGLITETEIADDSISTPKLRANSVAADKIQSNTIGTDKLISNSVTAAKINVTDLSAISADMGTVTAGTFRTDPAEGPRVEISGEAGSPLWIGDGARTGANGRLEFTGASSLYIRDNSGKILMSSAGDLADEIVNRPGTNLVNARYSTFDESDSTLPPMSPSASVTTSRVSHTDQYINGSLELKGSSVDNYLYFGNSTTDYNFTIPPYSKFIVSCFAMAHTDNRDCQLYIKTGSGTHNSGHINVRNFWSRHHVVLNLTSLIDSRAILRVDINESNNTVFFDGFMVEVMQEGQEGPSPYAPPQSKLTDHAVSPSNAGIYIADLSVDTLQIASQAVTVPVSVASSNISLETNSSVLVASTTFDCKGGGYIATYACEYWKTDKDGAAKIEIWINGQLRRTSIAQMRADSGVDVTWSIPTAAVYAQTGSLNNITVDVYAKLQGAEWANLRNGILTVMGGRR